MLSSLKNKFDHWVLSPVTYLGIPVKLLESITIREDIANDVVNIGYMYKKLDIVHLGCDNHPMVMRRIKREARSVLEEILKRNPSILTEDFSDYTIPLEVFPALLLDQIVDLTELSGSEAFLFTLNDVITRGLAKEYVRETDDIIRDEDTESDDTTEDTTEDTESDDTTASPESASRHTKVFTNLNDIFPFIKAFVENRKGYYPSPMDMAQRIKKYPIPIIKGRKFIPPATVVWDGSSRKEFGDEGKLIQTGRLRPRFVPSGEAINVSSLWASEGEKLKSLDQTEPKHVENLKTYTAHIEKFVDDMVGMTALHDAQKKYREQKAANPEAQITPPQEADVLLRYDEARFTGTKDGIDDISPAERIQKEIHNVIELLGEDGIGKELAAQFPENEPIKILKDRGPAQQAPILPKALPKWGTKEWKDSLPAGDSLAYFALQEKNDTLPVYEKIINAASKIYNDIKAELTELKQKEANVIEQINAIEDKIEDYEIVAGDIQPGERNTKIITLGEHLGVIQSNIRSRETRLKDIVSIPRYLESIPAKESLGRLKDLYDLVRPAYIKEIAQEVKAFRSTKRQVYTSLTPDSPGEETIELSDMSPEKIYMTIKEQAGQEFYRRRNRESEITTDEIDNSQGRKYVTYEIVLATATNKHFDNVVVYAEEASDARLNKQIHVPGGAAAIRNNYRNDTEDADLRRLYNEIKDRIQVIDFIVAISPIEKSITSIAKREGYGIVTHPTLKQGPNQQVGVITVQMPDPKTGVRKDIEVVIRRADELPAKMSTALTDENERIGDITIARALNRESPEWHEHIMAKYDGVMIKVPFPPGGDMFTWRFSPDDIIKFAKKFPDTINGKPNFATYTVSYKSLRKGNPVRTIEVETGLSHDEIIGHKPDDVLKKRLMKIVKQQPDFNPEGDIRGFKVIKKTSALACLFKQLDYQTTVPIMRRRKTDAASEDDIAAEYLWGIYIVPKDAIFNPNTTPPVGAKQLENGTIVPDETKTSTGRKAVSPLFGYPTMADACLALTQNILELDGDLKTRNPVRGFRVEPKSGMKSVEFNTRDGTKRIVLATYQNKKSLRSVIKLLTNLMPPNYELQNSINFWKTREDPSDPTSPLMWKPDGFIKFIAQKLKPTGLTQEDVEKAFRQTIKAIARNVYRKFKLRDKEQDWDDVSQEALAIFWRLFENDNKRAVWATLVKDEKTKEKKFKYYANIGTVGGRPDHNDLRKTIIAEWADNDPEYFEEAAAKAIANMQPVNDDDVWIFSKKNSNKKWYFAPDEPQFIDPISGKPTLEFIKSELRLLNISEDKLDDVAEIMHQGIVPAYIMNLDIPKEAWPIYRSGDFTRNGVKKDIFIALPTNDKNSPSWETSVEIFAGYLQENSDLSVPELDKAVEELEKNLQKTKPDFARYASKTLGLELTKRFVSGGRGRIISNNPGGTWQTFLVNAPIARYDVYVFDFISIPNGIKYRWERNNVVKAGNIPTASVKAAIESYANGEHFKQHLAQEEVPDAIQILMRDVNCHVWQYRNEMQSTQDQHGSKYVDRLPEVHRLITRILTAYSKQVEQEITRGGKLRYYPEMKLKTVLKPYTGDPWTILNMSMKEYLDKSIYVKIIPLGKTISADTGGFTPDERETTIYGGVRTSVQTPDKIAMTKEQAINLLNNSGLTDEQIEIIKVKHNLDDEQSLIGFFRDLANQERNQEQEWVDKETGMRFPVEHNIYRDNIGLEFKIPVNMEDDVAMKMYIENDLNFTNHAQQIQDAAKAHFSKNMSIGDVIDILKASNPEINQQWIPKLVEMAQKNQIRSTDDIAGNLEFVGPAKPTRKKVGTVLQNRKFKYNGWECSIGKETFLISLPRNVTPKDEQGRTLILKKLKDIANSSYGSAQKTRTVKGIPVYQFIQPIVKQAMDAAPITSKEKPPEEPEDETVWQTKEKERRDINQEKWLTRFNAELNAGIESLAQTIIPKLQRASTRIKKGDDKNDESIVADILKQDINEILNRLELQAIQGQPKDRDFTLSFSEEEYDRIRNSMNRFYTLAKSQPKERAEYLDKAETIKKTLDAIKTKRAFYDSGTGMYFASKDVGEIAQTIKNVPKIITYHCPKYDIDFYNPYDPKEITELLRTNVNINNDITITKLAELWMKAKKADIADIDMYKKNVRAISAKEATIVQQEWYKHLIKQATMEIINAKWEDDAETDLYINATMTTKTAGLEVAEKIRITSKSALDISVKRMAEEINNRLHDAHQSVQQRDKVSPERAQQLVQQLRDINDTLPINTYHESSTKAISMILDIGPSKVMLDALNDMMMGADEFKNDTAMRLSDLDTKIIDILKENNDKQSIINAFKKLFGTTDENQAYRMAYKIFNVYTPKKYGGGTGGGSERKELWNKIDDSNINKTGLESEHDTLNRDEADHIRGAVYKQGSIHGIKLSTLSPKTQERVGDEMGKAYANLAGDIQSQEVELPSADDM